MLLITPKISFLNKTNIISAPKPYSVPFKGVGYDAFVKSKEADEYEIDTKNTLKKLKNGELSKEYLDEFLLKFQGIDKEFAQEILAQSVSNLNYCNFLGQLKYLKNKSKLNDIELVKLSSFSDMVKYFSQRQNIRIFSSNNYSKNSNKNSSKFGVIDGIFSRELTQDEIKILGDLKHLAIINLNDFEVMPNFIDFAISDKKAKEKMDKLIKRAKEILENYPGISYKEAILKAKNEIFSKNLDKINELRQAKGKALVKIYSAIAGNDDYKNIAKNINSISNLQLPIYQNEIDFLKQMVEVKFQRPQELMNALASDEFTYYSPKVLITSLKKLMRELRKQLKEDDIDFDKCLFVYKDSKSEAFFGHLLEEMGEIKKEQRILYNDAVKYLNENKNPDDCIIYVDDILGTGDTVERYFSKLKNCKKYCAHIVSCKKGREYLKDYDINQVYVKNSFNGSKSKNKLISFHSLPSMFGSLLGQYCYSSEIFFYSYPDTASDPYQDFAHKILGIQQRKEYP